MTKVHHTVYKPRYEAYILDTITDYDGNGLPTREAKINHLFTRFYSEFGGHAHLVVGKFSEQEAIAEWLQGMALDIECYYHDIVDMAVRFGSIDPNPSDKLYNKVCENYWSFMANIILGMRAKS